MIPRHFSGTHGYFLKSLGIGFIIDLSQVTGTTPQSQHAIKSVYLTFMLKFTVKMFL